MAGPLRIPLSWPLNARAAGLDFWAASTDARRINVMDEPRSDGQPGVYTVKRPGTAVLSTPWLNQPGQGLAFINGSTFSVFNDTLYVGTPVSSGTDLTAWTNAGVPPFAARFGHRAVTLRDQIFVLGGNNGTTYNNDVWVSADGVNWRIASSSPPFGQRYGFGAAVLNGRIYVFGGYSGATYYSDVYSSEDGTTWQQETPNALWGGRYNFGTCTGNNGIYLFGGGDSTGAAHNDLWYSADGKEWVNVLASGPLPAVRLQPSLFWYHNKLFIVGGSTAVGGGINDCWSSPNGQAWTQLTTAAFTAPGSYAHGHCIYGDKMWVIGGATGLGAYSQRTYSSSDGATWTLVSSALPSGAIADIEAVVFRTPTGFRYPSVWTIGGAKASLVNDVNYGTLNLTVTSQALSPTTALQPYQIESFKNGTQILIKNQSNLWIFSEGACIKVLDIGYPKVTVPGIVVLGGFAYVMDPTGLIQNCALDDPFTWPSLNALGADYADDAGVALAKLQNYVVAYGQYTTQFFRDAGLDVGSPLVPYLAANLKVGCAYASSIAEVAGTLAWLSQTRQGERQALLFNGLSPEPFSSFYIDKVIAESGISNITGLSFGCDGHLFYALQASSGSTTLVYDFKTKQWYEWTNSAGARWNFAAAATFFSPGSHILQGATTGKIYALSTVYNADDTGAFPVLLQTQRFDTGNNRMKFWGRLDLLGDRHTGNPAIAFSDDDYLTWCAARTVDMTSDRPSLFRNGASRRRAFKLTVQDANPMRLEALEQEYATSQTPFMGYGYGTPGTFGAEGNPVQRG